VFATQNPAIRIIFIQGRSGFDHVDNASCRLLFNLKKADQLRNTRRTRK